VLGYRETLRRLTINDPRFLDSMFGADPPVAGAVDAREMALMRFASLVAIGGPATAFAHAVSLCLAAGATEDEVAATLVAVAPIVGTARVVKAAPKVALGLGYDVEADLEAWPEPPE
jgi:alkylhydroperoxidase/carboxymuconolactone decarboxylase family protein YurZ